MRRIGVGAGRWWESGLSLASNGGNQAAEDVSEEHWAVRRGRLAAGARPDGLALLLMSAVWLLSAMDYEVTDLKPPRHSTPALFRRPLRATHELEPVEVDPDRRPAVF